VAGNPEDLLLDFVDEQEPIEESLKLIDESPRTGIRGSRVAFVHPAATGSVLTEIVQPAEDH